MSKIFTTLFLLFCLNNSIYSQSNNTPIYLKYNLSYSLMTYWNQSFGFEIPIKQKMSFQTMFVLGTPLLSLNAYHIKQPFCIRITPELRYYLAKKNESQNAKGFYAGIFTYYQYQLLSAKPYSHFDYTNNIQVNKDKATWNYHYMGGGISIGYQFQMLKSKKLLVDINTGVQYSHISYHTDAIDNGNDEYNFRYSRYLTSNDYNFKNNKINLIDPRLWICVGYKIR